MKFVCDECGELVSSKDVVIKSPGSCIYFYHLKCYKKNVE